MSDGNKRWGRNAGCGCFGGCGTLIFVFLLGGLLSLFNAAFGIGLSVGVPFMQSNVTVAGAIGTKAKTTDGLPTYTKDRLAGNQNFINQSGTVTVGPAEGAGVFIVGKQDGAPAVDLFIALR
ncbi:MAG TPA: hypothetical protein VI814_09450 [Candidatus Limnocylindria bacterium]